VVVPVIEVLLGCDISIVGVEPLKVGPLGVEGAGVYVTSAADPPDL